MYTFIMERFKLKISDIVNTGHGIGTDKLNNHIYVLGAFPGDIIIVEIYKKLDKIYYGKLISILKPSIDRVFTPNKEPFFDSNAPWKHISFEAENKYKIKIINELYANILYKDIIKKFYSKPKNEIGYRNKVAYTFLDTKKGLKFALYTRGIGDKKKIEQKENSLAHPLIEKVGKLFLNFLNQKKIKSKQLKYLILRYSFSTNTISAYLLLPETNRKKLPIKKKDLDRFIKNNNQIQGIIVAHSDPKIRSSISDKTFYNIGDTDIKEKILDKKYIYHPSLFFQINPIDFKQILCDLREQIKKINGKENTQLLDLFAGVGIIGIELSDLVHDVRGIELSSLSKEYAIKNSKVNKIRDFSFYESNVNDVLEYIKKEQILIIDPPRHGITQKTIDRITEQKPEYILYVSCNPETQRRDYEKIKNIYNIIFLRGYNLFPKTHHIESLIVLQRK